MTRADDVEALATFGRLTHHLANVARMGSLGRFRRGSGRRSLGGALGRIRKVDGTVSRGGDVIRVRVFVGDRHHRGGVVSLTRRSALQNSNAIFGLDARPGTVGVLVELRPNIIRDTCRRGSRSVSRTLALVDLKSGRVMGRGVVAARVR